MFTELLITVLHTLIDAFYIKQEINCLINKVNFFMHLMFSLKLSSMKFNYILFSEYLNSAFVTDDNEKQNFHFSLYIHVSQ